MGHQQSKATAQTSWGWKNRDRERQTWSVYTYVDVSMDYLNTTIQSIYISTIQLWLWWVIILAWPHYSETLTPRREPGNGWRGVAAGGPCFIFNAVFFSLPVIPVQLSVRAAIHHWLDYLAGWEWRSIHLCSWHSVGWGLATLPPLTSLLLIQLQIQPGLKTHPVLFFLLSYQIPCI